MYFKDFCISNRDYLDDYFFTKKSDIDMSISGKFLIKGRVFDYDVLNMDSYPKKEVLDNIKSIISSKYNIDGRVLIGSGANGLIQNFIKILFAKKGNLVTPYYTFNEAEYGVTSFGGTTKRIYCDNYRINLKRLKESIDSETRMVYICNPNNPTGEYIESKKLIEFAKQCSPVAVVVDESCIEFTGKESILDYTGIPNNLIVIRTFSKAYGLANMRIGFAIVSPKYEKIYDKNITINEVSDISIIMATQMMKEEILVSNNVEMVIKERERIIEQLGRMGIECLPSSSNIIMTKTYFPKKFIKYLEDNNVTVVKVYDELKHTHLRIAVQDRNTNKIFIKKMMEAIKQRL